MTMPELFEDLKQFIDARFAQQDAHIEELIDQKLEEKLDQKLEEKFELKLAPIRRDIAELTEFVLTTFDNINELRDQQFGNHERRIRRLEHRFKPDAAS